MRGTYARLIIVAALTSAVLLSACGTTTGSVPPAGTPTPPGLPTPTSVPESRVEAGTAAGEPTTVPPKREAQVAYVGSSGVKAVAVTFDTGVNAGYTADILEILKKHGKKATFGITGQWAAANPDLLKRIVKEGHALINHSWSHASFTGEDTDTPPLTAEQIRDELERTDAKIRELVKVSTKPYFRPPYGDYDSRVNTIAWEAGYEYNVLWLVDGMGWAGRSSDAIVSVTLANAAPGAIFLLHVDNAQEHQALEKVIEGLDAAGLTMVTVPQLLEHQPMPMPTPTPAPSPTPEATPRLTPSPAPPRPTPTLTPTPIPAYHRLAFDSFETGDGRDGFGWLGPWEQLESLPVSDSQAHTGRWHLNLSSTIVVRRAANLAGLENIHLRFWSRLRAFPPPRAGVLISTDGVEWRLVRQFSQEENDGVYRLYDIDLSQVNMSATFFVAFSAVLDPLRDLWFVDDVELAQAGP